MLIRFTKMEGLGNDFVVIDALRQVVRLDAGTVRRLSDRHFGIGFDQLLLVEPPQDPEADFRYRIFNADGSEVAQCGNGARCFARFVVDQGLFQGKTVRVETLGGRLVLRLLDDGAVEVDMGTPRHAPDEIPLRARREAKEYELETNGEFVHCGAVSLGNPHLVLRVEDLRQAPVESLGPRLESHPFLPDRANVGFMEVLDAHQIRLRVYERGAGETLACGSGACAAVVVGIEWGCLQSPVRVSLPGGDLEVRWAGRGQSVFLKGPARPVFEGEIEL